MGLFSWKTMDTDRSICCKHSNREVFPVTMTDNKGNSWHEYDYDGYGEFGGKDFYELLAEMSGGGDRDRGITIAFGDDPYLSPNLTESHHWKWIDKEPESCEYQGFFYGDDDEEES